MDSSEDLLKKPPKSVSPAMLLYNATDSCDKLYRTFNIYTKQASKLANQPASQQASISVPESSNPAHIRCYLPRDTSDPTDWGLTPPGCCPRKMPATVLGWFGSIVSLPQLIELDVILPRILVSSGWWLEKGKVGGWTTLQEPPHAHLYCLAKFYPFGFLWRPPYGGLVD